MIAKQNIFFKYLGVSKPKGLYKTAKIAHGNLCRREIDPSFNKLHILGTVNFKNYYINNVNAETTGRKIL